MVRKVSFMTFLWMVALTAMAFAAEKAAGGGDVTVAGINFFTGSAIAAGLAITFAACGCGVGMGIASSGALQGIARNPETSGKLTVTMLIGFAMIESLTIYALVIALILIYANPASKLVQAVAGLAK